MFKSLQRFSGPAGVFEEVRAGTAWVVRADGVPERLPGAEAKLLQHLPGVGRLWCGEGTVAQGSAWRSRAGGRARVLGWQQRWEWGAGGSAGTN